MGYEDDVNLYSYTANDPVNFMDDTGNDKKWVGWAIRFVGDKTKYLAKVTKEQAIRLRRQEQDFRGRTRQQSRQVEVAAHGEKGLLRHKPHKDGYLPHYQSEGKSGHSSWTIVAATVLGLTADAVDSVADAAQSVGETLNENADAVSDIAMLLDPTSLLTSGPMDPPPGFTEGPMGLWIKVNSKEDSDKADRTDNKAEKVQCPGSRILREHC